MNNGKMKVVLNKRYTGRPVLLVLFLAIEIFIVLFFLKDYSRHADQYREQLLRAFDTSYKGVTTGYDYTTQVIFDDEVNKPEVLKLIASALDDNKKRDERRNELYRLMLPSYEKQKSMGISQFHFNLKDGTSFLRMHAPEQYGDNLLRRTAVFHVNKEKKPVKGYEVGYFADGYRLVYPLFYNGRHVGSVEFGITSEGIINYLEKIYPAHYLFMIDRTVVDNMTYTHWGNLHYRESGLSGDFMIGLNTAEGPIVASINQKLGNRVRDRIAHMERFVEKETLEGKNYLITFIPIRDVKGEPAAYFIQYINDDYLVHQSRIAIIDIILFTLLLSAIFYSIDNIQSRRKSLEQKNIELERATNELQQYKLLSRYARDIILFIGLDGRIMEANEAAERAYGCSREELLSLRITDLRGRDTLHSIEEQMGRANEHGILFETVHRRRDGTTFPVEVSSIGVDIGMQRVLLSIIRDISGRKKAEEALRESEEIFRSFMDYSPIYVFFKDENIRSIRLSRNFETMLGRPIDELLGKNMYDLFPSDLAKGMIENDMQIMSEGKTIIVEEEFNGRVYSTIKFPIHIDGKPRYLAGYTIDITDQRKDEEKIRKALTEKETLIREIHHRVKNNMQVITSLLKLQAQKIQDNDLKKPFEESEQRIRAMALVHERLYQQGDLSGINFSEYIHNIISELKIAYRIDGRKVAIKINVADIVLEVDSAIPCGLIINELITNCFKYAFPEDRSGEVIINFTKEESVYNLTIKDNGVGLPDGFDYRKTDTLGMQIVTVLAKQLLGTFRIRSDTGTEAVIAFTKKERIDGKEKNNDS